MTIQHDLSFPEYAALPGWNWSLIKLLEDASPLHVQHARNTPDEDTTSRGLLRAVHALVLEPQNFGASFSVYDGVRRGAKYDAHIQEHPGTTVLNVREHDQAHMAADAIRSHPAVSPLLSSGAAEVSMTWTDADTGLPCKARMDWLGPALVDLKTLGTTNEHAVARMVAKNMYHGQMAHYDDGLRAHDIHVPAFLVVAEGKGAHDVAVFEVDEGIPDGSMHVGRELRKRLMAQLAECVRLNHWPGRHPDRQVLCLPSYALLDDSDSIIFGGENSAENEEAL